MFDEYVGQRAGGLRISRRAILHWIERLLFAIAILALGWYGTVRVVTTVQQARDNRVLEHRISARTDGTIIPTAPPRPERDSVIGRIEVPRLGITAIVREGTDDDTLEYAVGHLSDTALPGTTGNAALAGHRDTFFRNLKGIKAGDHIVITTPERSVTYLVRYTRVVAPTDVSVLDHTPTPMLTLITCYPFNYIGSAPDRFIVRAVAEETNLLPARPVATAGVLTLPGDATTAARVRPQRKTVGVAKAKMAIAAEPEKDRGKEKPKKKEKEKKRGFWRSVGRFFVRR